MKVYHIEQGSEMWFEVRKGKFTGSDIEKLMGTKDAFDKLILQKKAERFFGISQHEMDSFVSEMAYNSSYALDMSFDPGTPENFRYGHVCEKLAIEHYEKKYGEITQDLGFVEYSDTFGTSPDRYLVDKNHGLEIKSPVTLSAHYQTFQLKTAEDLKKYKKEYYWQVLANILACDAIKWDFVSYCPHPKIEIHKVMSCIEISKESVKSDLELLKTTIEKATEQLC